MLLRLIPTRIHRYLDYIIAGIIIILPLVAGYSLSGGTFWTLVIPGVFILMYSILTRYETSMPGLISMRTNLVLDFLTGLFLLISPFLLETSVQTHTPHIIFGILLLILCMVTRLKPGKTRQPVLKPFAPSKTPERKWSGVH